MKKTEKKSQRNEGRKLRWRLQTVRDLARHLGLSEEFLLHFHAPMSRYYRSWDEPKRSGGTRPIDCPREKLKQVQSRINERLLQRTRVHRTAMGGIRGKRLADNAKLHAGRPMLAKFDLQDFFMNITPGQVYDCYVSMGCSPDVARILTRLTTYKGRVPQGAPTSTMLANLVAAYQGHSAFNERLGGLATCHGATTTTWVDDVALSGPRYLPRLQGTVERIARQSGFVPNKTKNKFMGAQSQQFLTGLVVNQKPNVSKEKRRALRAELHRCKTQGPAAVAGGSAEKLKSKLRSTIAHVQSVNPAAGAKLLAQFHEIPWSGQQ